MSETARTTLSVLALGALAALLLPAMVTAGGGEQNCPTSLCDLSPYPYNPFGESCDEVQLASTEFFTMGALRVRRSSLRSTDGAFRIYAITRGSGTLRVEGRPGDWRLAPGDVWLVPAVCGYHRLEPGPQGLESIEMTAPPS